MSFDSSATSDSDSSSTNAEIGGGPISLLSLVTRNSGQVPHSSANASSSAATSPQASCREILPPSVARVVNNEQPASFLAFSTDFSDGNNSTSSYDEWNTIYQGKGKDIDTSSLSLADFATHPLSYVVKRRRYSPLMLPFNAVQITRSALHNPPPTREEHHDIEITRAEQQQEERLVSLDDPNWSPFGHEDFSVVLRERELNVEEEEIDIVSREEQPSLPVSTINQQQQIATRSRGRGRPPGRGVRGGHDRGRGIGTRGSNISPLLSLVRAPSAGREVLEPLTPHGTVHRKATSALNHFLSIK